VLNVRLLTHLTAPRFRPALAALAMMFTALSAVISAPLMAQTQISSARLWPAPDHTRLVFDVDGSAEHSLFALENPPRLVLDLKNTRLSTPLGNLDLTGSPINNIRWAARNGDDLRVVFDLKTTALKPRSFLLQPNQQYGLRLVVDLFEQSGTKLAKESAKPAPKTVAEVRDPDVIVVIDAGHGGEDPGAIGPSRIREKDIVLQIAKRLRDRINKEPGFRAELTRTGDYYIGLRQRTALARAKQADLFVSVHADAFKDSRPYGASVFALSERGATSESARWLAQSENQADLIGGAGSVSLNDRDPVLAGVLLDLSMTASINSSLGVGGHVLGRLDRVTKLHKPRVEQAAFMVLKSPDIPSILVEAGFISNPGEERKLRSSAHQERIAEAVFEGVKDYFTKTPPPGTRLAQLKAQRELAKAREYRIRSGDTLSEVARRNRISVADLKRANGLTNDTVFIGQKLQIPSS